MSTTDPTTPAAPAPLSGLRDLAERFDGFIVDLWGCLHNGVAPFEGVVDGLQRLRAAGKRVVVLSNAPRRAAAVAAGMARLGIDPALVDHVHCSGESTWQALAARRDAWHRELGDRAFHIGPERDLSLFEGNGVAREMDLDCATFMLATGPNADDLDVAAHIGILEAAQARGLPLLCANPDHEVIRGADRLVCAGAIAARYAALGGDVGYHGKPWPAVYAESLGLLGVADRARVVAIGDGLRTDIAGAAAAGLASAFIPGGVHGESLSIVMGGLPKSADLARLLRGEASPSYVLPRFAW